ncbi:hypothetical protein AB0D74_12225 [Streptomyces sp. NPDC048278]|uniref:hypothetical protein n=1 Tax=Streptomyces sp. NPDC048278 TaxID=3155809 RepID=UPI00341FA9C6
MRTTWDFTGTRALVAGAGGIGTQVAGALADAGAALFLATEDAGHITGGFLVADGGYNMIGA